MIDYKKFKKELLKIAGDYICNIKKNGKYITIYPNQAEDFTNTDVLSEIVQEFNCSSDDRLNSVVWLIHSFYFDREVLETDFGTLIPVAYSHFNTTVYYCRYKITEKR